MNETLISHLPLKLTTDTLSCVTLVESVSSSAIYIRYRELVRKKAIAKKNSSAFIRPSKYCREIFTDLTKSTISSEIESSDIISWRLFNFLSNHFSVSVGGPLMTALAPSLEREAIAPNMLGKFEDLLLAVIRHPAMLIYLNNQASFGENSKFGKEEKGFNENLAREILELHTLGVNGGYDQKDVTELAKAITGWSINKRILSNIPFGYRFKINGHEPGTRFILGKEYKQIGEQQGIAALRDIANHSSTAYFFCRKLAIHFLNDMPDEKVIYDMIKEWGVTGGKLKMVIEVLINSTQYKNRKHSKFKSPRDFVVSTYQLLELKNYNETLNILKMFGQKPFHAGSPAGFGDTQSDWLSPNSILLRAKWASTAANTAKVSKIDINSLIEKAFGKHVSEKTKKIILRAESKINAITLLLMSPEFQRR
jgi:uncharacterized protein (DUF1800 family)